VTTTNFRNWNLCYGKSSSLRIRIMGNTIDSNRLFPTDAAHRSIVYNPMPVTESFVTDELVASSYEAVFGWNGNTLGTNVKLLQSVRLVSCLLIVRLHVTLLCACVITNWVNREIKSNVQLHMW
jgi:hypothetical protein